jgi:hypothetical protein
MAAHRPRRLDINGTQKANIAQVIQQLPVKGCSLRDLIADMRTDIQQAIDRGYSYREMAAILQDQGVKIAPRTLRTYLNAGKSQDCSRAKSRSSQGGAVARPVSAVGKSVVGPVPNAVDGLDPPMAITIGDFTEISDVL